MTTINFDGHIESIGLGSMNNIRLEIYGSSLVVQKNPIFLEVTKFVAEGLLPGTLVKFTVEFLPKTS